MKVSKPPLAGGATVHSAKYFLMVTLCLLTAACAASLPSDAEQVATSKARSTFESRTAFMATPGGTVSSNVPTERIRQALATIKYHLVEALPGQVSDFEKSNGFSDAWCVKLEFTADVPDEPTLPTGKFVERYVLVVMKQFQGWLVSEGYLWKADVPETAMLPRCNMHINNVVPINKSSGDMPMPRPSRRRYGFLPVHPGQQVVDDFLLVRRGR